MGLVHIVLKYLTTGWQTDARANSNSSPTYIAYFKAINATTAHAIPVTKEKSNSRNPKERVVSDNMPCGNKNPGEYCTTIPSVNEVNNNDKRDIITHPAEPMELMIFIAIYFIPHFLPQINHLTIPYTLRYRRTAT